MGLEKRKIINLTEEEIDEVVNSLPLHGGEVLCKHYGISACGYLVEKPHTAEEIAKDLNLHIEVVKYWLEMDICMLKHPARNIDMSGDFEKEFIELGNKLRK